MCWRTRAMPRALCAVVAFACAVAGTLASPTGDSEFSLSEFFDIKRVVANMKVREVAKELKKVRSKTTELRTAAPKSPSFYGQDHYQQSFNQQGKEVWTHVGRPDELIYDMFFKSPIKYNGTFVEVGAADGIRSSNTLFFEESLGWSGLLIEGATESFLKLFAEPRRKRSTRVYSAICRNKGTVKFLGDGLAAGSIEDMTRHHIESWGRHFKSLRLYEVPCDSMKSIMKQAKLPRTIDLMSIDIEGSEYRALSTINWGAHNIRVLVVEPGHTCFQNGKNACAQLLKDEGFCLVARRAVNEFWVSDPLLKSTYCL